MSGNGDSSCALNAPVPFISVEICSREPSRGEIIANCGEGSRTMPHSSIAWIPSRMGLQLVKELLEKRCFHSYKTWQKSEKSSKFSLSSLSFLDYLSCCEKIHTNKNCFTLFMKYRGQVLQNDSLQLDRKKFDILSSQMSRTITTWRFSHLRYSRCLRPLIRYATLLRTTVNHTNFQPGEVTRFNVSRTDYMRIIYTTVVSRIDRVLNLHSQSG